MELSDATEMSPVTPMGIDPGTFRLVAQCLNHYATPGTNYKKMNIKYDYIQIIWSKITVQKFLFKI
jgi:hypothetical protein